MSIIFKTSSGEDVSVSDATIDKTYAIALVGKDAADYTEPFAQTLLQLHENFSSPTSPENNGFVNYNNSDQTSPISITPVTGQLWYDAGEESLKVYNANPSSEHFGWTRVASDANSISVVPANDGQQNIGTEDRYWHNVYASHVYLNPNRYLGQVGKPDPDGIEAMNVDGNVQLDSTTGITEIKIKNGTVGILGNIARPLYRITTDTLLFGQGDYGLTIDPSNTDTILPMDIISAGEPDIKLGNANEHFEEFYTNNIRMPIIRGKGDTVTIKTDVVLSPSGTNTTIGRVSNRVSTTYTGVAKINNLSGINGNFSTEQEISEEIYTTGYTNVADGDLESDDQLCAEDANGNLKLIYVLDLLPVGAIMLWGEDLDELPNGWALCDGSTHGDITTPSMNDRMIQSVVEDAEVGASGESHTVTLSDNITESATTGLLPTDELHDHGGAQPHQLTLDEIPSHRHSIKVRPTNDNEDNDAENISTNETSNSSTSDNELGDGTHDHGIIDSTNHSHGFTIPTHDHTVDMEDASLYRITYMMKVA